MARDALLLSGGVFAASALTTAASPTPTYSPAISMEPFNTVGWNNNLYARFMMSQPSYLLLPAVTPSYFQFTVDVSQDGTTWTSAYVSPTDAQVMQTHRVYELRNAGSASSSFTINKPSVSTATGATTSGSATLTGLPQVSVGDVVYLTASAGGFTLATPYYVLTSVPTVNSNVNNCTVTLSATPGGPPVVATATASTMTWTKYFPLQFPFNAGDMFLQTGTAITGTNTATAAADTTIATTGNVTKYYILSQTNSYNLVTVTFANAVGGAATTSTGAIGATTTYAVFPNYSNNAEYYFPLNSSPGFIDLAGNTQDNFKYIRGSVRHVCATTGINPTAIFRFDVVPGRDGAYS